MTRMQRLKTGALIAFACGLALLGWRPSRAAALLAFAYDLGLAFQIVDDLLDTEGDAGDSASGGQGRTAGKATFVSLLGVDGRASRPRLCPTGENPSGLVRRGGDSCGRARFRGRATEREPHSAGYSDSMTVTAYAASR